MTIVVVTTVRGRHEHLAAQHAWLARARPAPDRVVVVAMRDPEIRAVVDAGPLRDRATVVDVPDRGDLPLARARNLGAAEAWRGGADLAVFLDVDCLPASSLLAAYRSARDSLAASSRAVLCGPVAYLPPPGPAGYGPGDLDTAEPHPARPAPDSGSTVRADRWELFWSLSFAIDRPTWEAVGGFDEGYSGYGGEDTDFGQRARCAGAGLYWVGAARAFHQWHRVSDPPVEHLHDIVANANRFHARWGWFPMTGWLEAFAQRGLAELTPQGSWAVC